MVHAWPLLRQVLGNAAGVIGGLHQFNVRIACFQESDLNLLLWNVLYIANRQPQRITPEAQVLGDVAHHHGHMVNGDAPTFASRFIHFVHCLPLQ